MDPIDQKQIDQATAPAVPQEDQIPSYNYKDIQSESIREIATNTELPEDKLEKLEEKVVTPDEVTKPEDETPLEDVIKAVVKETAEELKPKEEPKEPEPTDKEKKYLDWEKKFNTDNNRPPSYLEALSFVEEQAQLGIEEKQKAAAKAQEEEQAKAKTAQEEQDKRLNAIVDDELNDLYNANKLTKITDPNNPSDQGVVERKALFAKWQEVNTQRRAEGKPEILSATRIYEFYFTKPNAQPAGADAPISGNKGSTTTPNEEQTYTYKDIKKPWSFFRQG